MTLTLDRIEIESAGSDPVGLARALIRQLPGLEDRVPIDEIARALDIISIEIVPLRGIEACLQCDARKSHGQIVVNTASSPRRRRFSIGHELGHFLNEAHEPTGSAGFDCTVADMVAPHRHGRHLHQEREANTFAIEVLTPQHLLERHLAPRADLSHALSMAERFDISRAAATRRYVGLHDECLAAVFTKANRIIYIEKPDGFPPLVPWIGDPVGPRPAPPSDGSDLTALDGVDPARWLSRPDRTELYAQTLYQQDGHATTLLLAERAEDTVDWDAPTFRR